MPLSNIRYLCSRVYGPKFSKLYSSSSSSIRSHSIVTFNHQPHLQTDYIYSPLKVQWHFPFQKILVLAGCSNDEVCFKLLFQVQIDMVKFRAIHYSKWPEI